MEELGISINKNGSSKAKENNGTDMGKRKAKREASQRVKKKVKYDWDGLTSSDEEAGSDFGAESDTVLNQEVQDSDEDVASDDFDEEEEDDFNPFGSGSEDDEDPWARIKRKAKRSKGKKGPKSKNGNGNKVKPDPYANLIPSLKNELKAEESTVIPSSLPGLGMPPPHQPPPSAGPSQANIDRACEMRLEMLEKIERLGKALPANTLDQLIDELGGPENVAEMTGRKGRVVQDQSYGDVRYESRSEADIPLETLNLAEKDRFMQGQKDVAIISEAASSGISLQADRRVSNQVSHYFYAARFHRKNTNITFPRNDVFT